MAPRVVITGLGVVSPNGIGKEAFCLSLLAGKAGVKRISRFDPSELPVHIAGEIPEFDELAWVDARERKHVSRAVPLSLAASTEAIKDAGLDPSAMSMEEKREIGVIIGTGGGAQEFSEEQYRLWHTRERQASQHLLHSQRHNGNTAQRNQHALRISRLQPCGDGRLYFLDRRYRLCLPAYPGWRAAHVSGRGRGFADHSGHHQRIFFAARADRVVEPFSRERIASVFRRPRWLCHRRRLLDVHPGRLRSCPRSRRPNLRRDHRVRFHL